MEAIVRDVSTHALMPQGVSQLSVSVVLQSRLVTVSLPCQRPLDFVRAAMSKDPKLQRPTSEVPELTAQQEYVWNWINKIDNSEFLNWKKVR
eukprot:40685-Eustigmatos_ZCMA.PRE.1